MSALRVLHIVAALNVETGGPAQSVPALADAQARAGMDVTVLSFDYRRHGPLCLPMHARAEIVVANQIAQGLRGWSLALAKRAKQLAMEHDVVHSHGLWMQVNRHARLAAMKADRPLVISPRGMLESYSLHRSKLRKTLAWWAFERKNLDVAALLHATSDLEANSISSVLPAAHTVVIPNVVEHLPAREVQPRRQRRVLYLGRLDQKKGLDWLLSAWLDRQPGQDGWELQIVGPCALGFESALLALKQQTQARADIVWAPALAGQDKHDLIASASLLVLPSRSENFGNVVIEALAHGVPVLATDATPWRQLPVRGAGWSVPTSASGVRDGLAVALAELTEHPGARVESALALAAEFRPEAVATAWRNAYASLLKSKP